MEINRKKTLHVGKENNCEHFNKKDSDTLAKDRLFALKRHHELAVVGVAGGERERERERERGDRELRVLRNSKEVRGAARSVVEKVKSELKPLVEPSSNTQQYCQTYGSGVVAQS